VERTSDGRDIHYYRQSPDAAAGERQAHGAAVLVTGGAGYVAGPLVARLVGAGRTVVVLDNLSSSSGRTLPRAVTLVTAPVGDAVALREIFGRWQIEAVFHFAADSQVAASLADPLGYFRHNIREGLTLLEETVAAGAPPLVFSSSAAVYGIPEWVPVSEQAPLQPISPYGESKAQFERILHWTGLGHGLRWAALRYFNAAGADGAWEPKAVESHLIPNVLRAAAAGTPVRVFGTDYPTPDGTAVRDYVHVADLAEGHLAALRHLQGGGESGAFNLGSGVGFSVAQVITAAEAVTGRSVRREAAARRPGDPPVLVADAARASAVLGWRPRVSGLERIVTDAWAAMGDAGAGPS